MTAKDTIEDIVFFILALAVLSLALYTVFTQRLTGNLITGAASQQPREYVSLFVIVLLILVVIYLIYRILADFIQTNLKILRYNILIAIAKTRQLYYELLSKFSISTSPQILSAARRVADLKDRRFVFIILRKEITQPFRSRLRWLLRKLGLYKTPKDKVDETRGDIKKLTLSITKELEKRRQKLLEERRAANRQYLKRKASEEKAKQRAKHIAYQRYLRHKEAEKRAKERARHKAYKLYLKRKAAEEQARQLARRLAQERYLKQKAIKEKARQRARCAYLRSIRRKKRRQAYLRLKRAITKPIKKISLAVSKSYTAIIHRPKIRVKKIAIKKELKKARPRKKRVRRPRIRPLLQAIGLTSQQIAARKRKKRLAAYKKKIARQRRLAKKLYHARKREKLARQKQIRLKAARHRAKQKLAYLFESLKPRLPSWKRKIDLRVKSPKLLKKKANYLLKQEQLFKHLQELFFEAQLAISAENYEKAKLIYKQLLAMYKKLPDEEKRLVHAATKELYTTLKKK